MSESAAATVATYCVFGNPIEHSLSPQIHTQFAQLTGQDMVYDKRLAPEGNFAPTALDFFAHGGLGCNITVPFKLDAELLADATSERVQLAGACNTLVKRDDGTLFGDNTDGLGLRADITQSAGFDIAGKRLLLIGTGQTSRTRLESAGAATQSPRPGSHSRGDAFCRGLGHRRVLCFHHHAQQGFGAAGANQHAA